ncbi:hypothetical protein MTBUT4_80066 [Magnetospirillum sp. UT-4]|nr:hypothetical protein MTBUT4_80066 [Magnetospirillum sp. UT-4]
MLGFGDVPRSGRLCEGERLGTALPLGCPYAVLGFGDVPRKDPIFISKLRPLSLPVPTAAA